jgi:hypothetical protein
MCRSNVFRESALRRLEAAAEALNLLYPPLHNFKQNRNGQVPPTISHVASTTQIPVWFESTTTMRPFPPTLPDRLDESPAAVEEESHEVNRLSFRKDSPVTVQPHGQAGSAGSAAQTTPTQTTPTTVALSSPTSPAYSEATSSYASTHSAAMSPTTPVTSNSEMPRSYFPIEDERKGFEWSSTVYPHYHTVSVPSPHQLRTLEPPVTSQPPHARSGVTSPEHYGLPPTSRGCI